MAQLLGLRPLLRGPHVVAELRENLRSPERLSTLYLLLVLDVRIVGEVLPELLAAGLRPRDAVVVREIVARLPRETLREKVYPEVRVKISSCDEQEWRRMAELLQRLGMTGELAEIVSLARESGLPGVREAAADFDL